MGGEHALHGGDAPDLVGSSPRGRGTHNSLFAGRLSPRFIPAWAGNTQIVLVWIARTTVHPRVGGEHSGRLATDNTYRGSSPRGRGTLGCGHLPYPGHRFIPAWAGNTSRWRPGCRSTSVHPRVGGEHHGHPSASVHVIGSSPRGRGTPTGKARLQWRGGFIPAWAGNTNPCTRDLGQELGSSPRGRGTHTPPGRARARRRFIPAWAGNTDSSRPRNGGHPVHPRVGGEHVIAELRNVQRSTPVHPRVGGEHWRPGGLGTVCSGSSPRGRGTPPACRSRCFHRRFIPAWAGNTARAPSHAVCISVHPRVGGEHVIAELRANGYAGSSPRGRGTLSRHRARGCRRNDNGSSPRGRGTHAQQPVVHDRDLFIPAWAGNTSHVHRSDRSHTVHPRVGGEHRLDGGDSVCCYRFIPAWAGNTNACPASSGAASVHPRVGGEHGTAGVCDVGTFGSSPRGRGTQMHADEPAARTRFIPAWAGNTP